MFNNNSGGKDSKPINDGIANTKQEEQVLRGIQPKHQLCTGFLLKLQSDFAIASLQISETPETVQNSKYNI